MKPKCVTIINKITNNTMFDHHEFDVNRGTQTGVCKNCGLIIIADDECWQKMAKKIDDSKVK